MALDGAISQLAVPPPLPAHPLARASLAPDRRLIAVPVLSFAYAGGLGAITGGRRTALQFLAENAHRLPTTMKGWYFYHKTKNYRVMYGALKHGGKMGAAAALLTGSFEAVEYLADRAKGTTDVFNSILAGMTVALVTNAAFRLPRRAASTTLKLGFGIGLLSGGAQDCLNYVKGEHVWYLDLVRYAFTREGTTT